MEGSVSEACQQRADILVSIAACQSDAHLSYDACVLLKMGISLCSFSVIKRLYDGIFTATWITWYQKCKTILV